MIRILGCTGVRAGEEDAQGILSPEEKVGAEQILEDFKKLHPVSQ